MLKIVPAVSICPSFYSNMWQLLWNFRTVFPSFEAAFCSFLNIIAMKIILEKYKGDLKLLEQDVRNKFSSRSGATKRMKKFETVYHAMTSASTCENPIEKIRNLLL